MFWTLVAAAVMIWDLLSGHWLQATVVAGSLGLYWRSLLRAVDGEDPVFMPVGWWTLGLAIIIASGVSGVG